MHGENAWGKCMGKSTRIFFSYDHIRQLSTGTKALLKHYLAIKWSARSILPILWQKSYKKTKLKKKKHGENALGKCMGKMHGENATYVFLTYEHIRQLSTETKALFKNYSAIKL